MKVTNAILSCCFCTGWLMSACTKDDNTENTVNDQDRTFLVQASISNNAELGAASLAVSKATNPAVVSYANQMLVEHSTSKQQLLSVGTTVGVTVPGDTVDPAHQAIMMQLMSMSGRAFDSAYITTQVADHNLAITMFQMEANSGSRTEVKGYANEQLPHLQMHKQRADSIKLAFYP